MYKPFRSFIWILTTGLILLTIAAFFNVGFGEEQIETVFGLSFSAESITLGVLLATCIMICFLVTMERVYSCNINGESIYVLREYLDRALNWEKELSNVMRNMDKFSYEDECKLIKALTILDRCMHRMQELNEYFPKENLPLVCMELSANLANIRTYFESTKDNDDAGEQANVPINVSVKDGKYNYEVSFMEDLTECRMNHKFTKGLSSINYLYKDEIREILEKEIASEIKNLISKDKKLQVEIDSFITEVKNQESNVKPYYVRNDTLRRKLSQALNLDTTIHLLEYILNSDILEDGFLVTTEYLTKNSSNYIKATVANTWALVPYVSENEVRAYLSGKVIEEVFGEGICYVIKMVEGGKDA